MTRKKTPTATPAPALWGDIMNIPAQLVDLVADVAAQRLIKNMADRIVRESRDPQAVVEYRVLERDGFKGVQIVVQAPGCPPEASKASARMQDMAYTYNLTLPRLGYVAVDAQGGPRYFGLGATFRVNLIHIKPA